MLETRVARKARMRARAVQERMPVRKERAREERRVRSILARGCRGTARRFALLAETPGPGRPSLRAAEGRACRTDDRRQETLLTSAVESLSASSVRIRARFLLLSPERGC